MMVKGYGLDLRMSTLRLCVDDAGWRQFGKVTAWRRVPDGSVMWYKG